MYWISVRLPLIDASTQTIELIAAAMEKDYGKQAIKAAQRLLNLHRRAKRLRKARLYVLVTKSLKRRCVLARLHDAQAEHSRSDHQ